MNEILTWRKTYFDSFNTKGHRTKGFDKVMKIVAKLTKLKKHQKQIESLEVIEHTSEIQYDMSGNNCDTQPAGTTLIIKFIPTYIGAKNVAWSNMVSRLGTGK